MTVLLVALLLVDVSAILLQLWLLRLMKRSRLRLERVIAELKLTAHATRNDWFKP